MDNRLDCRAKGCRLVGAGHQEAVGSNCCLGSRNCPSAAIRAAVMEHRARDCRALHMDHRHTLHVNQQLEMHLCTETLTGFALTILPL